MWLDWWLVVGAFGLLLGVVLGIVLGRSGPRRKAERAALEYARARRDFHHQREQLEAKFLEMAANSGKPRGLKWEECDFADGVVYARDRRTGELCAFVGVTISFSAVAGGGMEEVEAVGNLRAATAVFKLGPQRWTTDGRAIFNLNPVQAVAHFQDQLSLVGEE